MARWTDWNGSGKTAGASNTISFNASDLPFPVAGRSVVALHFTAHSNASQAPVSAADITNTTRVRVKANGATIVDCSPLTTLRSLVGQIGKRPNGVWGITRPSFTVPLNIFDLANEDQADLGGAPLNKQLSVDITTGASFGANTVFSVGWTLSDITPVFAPVILSSGLNIGASVTNGRTPLSEPGLVRAIGLPTEAAGVAASDSATATTYYTRWRVVLSGTQKHHGSYQQTLERENLTDPSLHVATAQTGALNPHFIRIVGMLPAAAGSSYIEADSGSAAAASDEYCIWALQQQSS